ncbi:sigma-54-dependent Fis family transcriptional regulator [candidate division KSB1 bacterium]|nr:sigma-54-dependent Fis family transcriptional regulator [candidate division KSB1 bacterium]RQW01646.1 MAG: sigma-54-dependent Fis family transcriptional regulator [candidate division KSB1 bacterium]
MGRFNQLASDALPGKSQAIERLVHVINTLSPLNTTVLLYGEPGTEKETVARLIHDKNPAASGEFVAVRLSAIPMSLTQEALFGQARGNGRRRVQPGYVERAANGTLFIEDIGDMDPVTQARLLQILQAGHSKRAATTGAVSAQARIVAGTSKNLKKLVQNGAFRQDLFYRLNFITLEIPPLRERSEDIPMLARHFLRKAAMRCGIRDAYLRPEVIAVLKDYYWPGNLRQLESTIQMLISRSAPSLPHDDDPLSERITSAPESMDCDQFLSIAEAKALFEYERFQHILRSALDHCSDLCLRRAAEQHHPPSSANDLFSSLPQRYNDPESETDLSN